MGGWERSWECVPLRAFPVKKGHCRVSLNFALMALYTLGCLAVTLPSQRLLLFWALHLSCPFSPQVLQRVDYASHVLFDNRQWDVVLPWKGLALLFWVGYITSILTERVERELFRTTWKCSPLLSQCKVYSLTDFFRNDILSSVSLCSNKWSRGTMPNVTLLCIIFLTHSKQQWQST